MSLSPFADQTLQVSWVLAQLDEILRMDESGRLQIIGDTPIDHHAETIRQAILSMRREIAIDRTLDVTLTASEMTPARLTTHFGLRIPNRRDLVRDEIKLHSHFIVQAVPPQLEINLDRLAHSDNVDCPDITSRLGVELLVLECQVELAETYTEFLKDPDPYQHHQYTERGIPPPSQYDRELPVRILADADLSVTVTNASTGVRTTITGRVDWAFGEQNSVLTGYDIRGYFGSFKVVQAAEFSSIEVTLVANLAIIRECQIQSGHMRMHMDMDGCYSDGVQYVFLRITTGNLFQKSRIFNIWRPGDLGLIYNLAMEMLDKRLRCLGC